MARGKKRQDGAGHDIAGNARQREETGATLPGATLTIATPTIERKGATGAAGGDGQQPRAPRPGPVSMLQWRRQTRAFDETNASIPAMSADGERTASERPTTPGVTSGSEASPAEKPVIIRGAGNPTIFRPEGRKSPGVLRSPAGRVVLVAAIAATLFTSLAVVVPSGAGAGIPAVFQSYANAMPWSAPTATPRTTNPQVTTNVTGATPSQQAIIADIQSVFGPNAAGALNVARCESSLDPHAWNPTPIGGSHASGVFQILYPSTWNGTSYRSYSPYDEWANVRAAYEIFKRDGYSWREWQCKP